MGAMWKVYGRKLTVLRNLRFVSVVETVFFSLFWHLPFLGTNVRREDVKLDVSVGSAENSHVACIVSGDGCRDALDVDFLLHDR